MNLSYKEGIESSCPNVEKALADRILQKGNCGNSVLQTWDGMDFTDRRVSFSEKGNVTSTDTGGQVV